LALTAQQKGSEKTEAKIRTCKKEPFKSIEIIGRDLNGALNILYKGKCILEGKEIPEYMNRKYPVLSRTA
jgi:hypothetical protein